MQVRGPSGEVLYLTEVKAEIPGFDLPFAGSFVDYPFIVILGGHSLEEIKQFYQQNFSVADSANADVRVSLLSAALGMPRDTLHLISAMPLKDKCYIEADEFPSGASERQSISGQLPPGIAIVSFEVEQLDQFELCRGKPAIKSAVSPYSGRRVAMLRGPAGELIELIETAE